jgi:hypothetical protein
MEGRAKGRQSNKLEERKTMKDSLSWSQQQSFGAVDWAQEKHSVIIVNQAGKVLEDFEIEPSALG